MDVSYDKLNEKIALLAPTGRASKRLSEATHLPAYTIHRFLKWNKETGSFQVDEYNRAQEKIIIVDEATAPFIRKAFELYSTGNYSFHFATSSFLTVFFLF